MEEIKFLQDLSRYIVQETLKLGSDESEVYLENKTELKIDVRNGDIEKIKQATSKGLGLRVFKDNRMAFSHTSDFSKKSLREMMNKTIRNVEVADAEPWNILPEFQNDIPKNLDLFDPLLEKISSKKKIEIAREIEKTSLSMDKRITKSYGGSYNETIKNIIIANSKGICHSQKSTFCEGIVAVIASEKGEMRRGVWISSKRFFKDLENSIEKIARIAAKRALEKLGAKSVMTQKVPVVIDRIAAWGFWWDFLDSINGEKFFQNSTFLRDYLNKPIASKIITIMDDPTIPRHHASAPFDGEGNLTRKNTLVEKGTLKMFIYDSATARKAGVKVNTMARRRDYRNLPYPDFLNVIVENGKCDLNKIISDIKNGVYIRSLWSSGLDISTGNFSSGASGFWIKNGEIAFPVYGITVGGDMLEILKSIEVVANDLEIDDFINSPSFKISEITIGGQT